MDFLKSQLQSIDDKPWSIKYKPTSKLDLAVRSEKINAVHGWIAKSLEKKNGILLISGPSGCGKLLTCLTYENVNFQRCENLESVEDFNEFLNRKSRYEDIDKENANPKILIVKEFPNQFFAQSHLFHNFLREFKQFGHCPLIIIISDSQTLEYSAHNLIPKPLQIELSIDHINFNPITIAAMKKALNNVLIKEGIKKSLKSKGDYDNLLLDIHAKCNGDIRSALNSLQMYFIGKKPILNNMNSVSKKDLRLNLFHAIGKVLYCKREQDPIIRSKELDKYSFIRKTDYRHPISINPEEVILSSELAPIVFANYLHTNYLDTKRLPVDVAMENMSKVADYCSQADCIFSSSSSGSFDWISALGRSELAPSMLACSVITRAVAFYTSLDGSSSDKEVGDKSSTGFKGLKRCEERHIEKERQEIKQRLMGSCDSQVLSSGEVARGVLWDLVWLGGISRLYEEKLAFLLFMSSQVARKDWKILNLGLDVEIIKRLREWKHSTNLYNNFGPDDFDDSPNINKNNETAVMKNDSLLGNWQVCRKPNEDDLMIEEDD